uniref:Elongin-C n=1 Tax=Zea mays TaxID=4577 RepID=K7W4T3_MAIZE|nr:elongin C [Zea mays]
MAPREHHQPQEEEEEDTAGVVKLISAEGFEFVVDKKAAMVSNTLRNMLTSPGGFSETRQGEVRFPEIPTNILEKICQYFYWSLHYSSPWFNTLDGLLKSYLVQNFDVMESDKANKTVTCNVI